MQSATVAFLEKHTDERGLLVEVLKAGPRIDEIKQVYFSSSKPGAIRGNHYHIRKTEWFYVAKGTALIALRDSNTSEREEIRLSGDDPTLVDVPPQVVHGIKNVTDDEMLLIVLSNEVFDPNDPDTHYADAFN